MNEVAREMPRYQSHKKVRALKIADIEELDDGAARVTPADEGYAPLTTRQDWLDRCNATDDDLGYYVVYEDGFTSWSPTEAFENGYTRI